MVSYLLDTHVWAWSIKFDKQLPLRLTDLLLTADSVHVSAVSFYEIAQKVRIGKWPDMEPVVNNLPALLADQGGQLVSITGEIAQEAGLLVWDHRDPFDRILAATSIVLKLPIMSADMAFDTLSDRKDWPGRVW